MMLGAWRTETAPADLKHDIVITSQRGIGQSAVHTAPFAAEHGRQSICPTHQGTPKALAAAAAPGATVWV